MPGKIKVKVLAGRNLPVMDRASDTTDAFVEIKFGNVTHKTDVCRKSLNPHWNSTEWYRFEVDESELQDEPLQLRLMDHDTYSANDAIGKVVISLSPLLSREAQAQSQATTVSTGGGVLSGWIPVFDTMHGIRGELNVIVKVELFSDFNKYKTSSCGVQFFHCPMIPPGFRAKAIHGFVEELVVNDDPEYQWIDKIRTPRASNEARQVAFIKLSNQVQRLVGVKAAELGANAVVGYMQDFDLEGEAGVVARAIGTAVTIIPLPSLHQALNIPPCTQQQLKKYLDILATDGESITDLNQYFQCHQDELQKLLSILNPITPSLLDDGDNNDDDEKSTELVRQLSVQSHGGSVSIYQDDYVSQKSLKHISEDQIELNRLLKSNRGDDSDSDSSGPLQKIKEIKTNFFTKRFGSVRSRKADKQDDQISIQSNSSDNSRISLTDLKSEFKKFKRIKKPKFRKPFVNKQDEGVGMASILARSVIHVHTSLACIAESQDSENSPSSTMRRTSESHPAINISDNEKPKDVSDVIAQNVNHPTESNKKSPETHTISLQNINITENYLKTSQRKLSESCPATPVIYRNNNFLKLPDEAGYFGSLSLSGESSEMYSSSEDDDESSDLKTDTERYFESTTSTVNLDNTNSLNEIDNKLTNLEKRTPEVKLQIDSKVTDELQTESSESLSSSVDEMEPMASASSYKIKSINACSQSNISMHFKFQNLFTHKKVSKSISAPSSPIERPKLVGFVYRSSKRIKEQILKISESNMIKSISHYSLIPKKKNKVTKIALSQPGSTSDVPSKAPSHETVLGSPFLSYVDLLSIDKEIAESSNSHCKSDEFEHSKVKMYIGSEPVSRASLSGPSSLYQKEDSHHQGITSFHLKKNKPGLKQTSLVHTAMETILIDKVHSLLVPTSPEPTESKEKEFFDRVSRELERVEEVRNVTETQTYKLDYVAEHNNKDSLVNQGIATILMDKVQSLLTPTDLFSPPEKTISEKENELKLQKEEQPTKKEVDPNYGSLFQSAIETILMDKVKTVIQPTENQSNKTVENFDDKMDRVQSFSEPLNDDVDQLSGHIEEKKNTSTPQDRLSDHILTKAVVLGSHHRFIPAKTECEKQSAVTENNGKKLIRQNSIHSLTDLSELSQKMSKKVSNIIMNPCVITKNKPVLQHFHPIISGAPLETIPSQPESSLDHTESLDIEGVENTCDGQPECNNLEFSSENNNASVCDNDNSHAACRFDRSDGDKEKYINMKDKGSPKHSRHESYGGREIVSTTPQPQNSSMTSSAPLGIQRRSSDSDLSITPKGGSLNTSAVNVGSGGGAILRPSMNSNNLEMLEYPFLTMTEYPSDLIVHLGGTVCARSVKLIDGGGESFSREAWWAELRTELRAHARVLRCNAVIAYRESAAICEDVCVLSASGTAAVINLDCDFTLDGESSPSANESKTVVEEEEIEREKESCLHAHVPYGPGTGPYRAELSYCGVCKKARVPAVLLATCSKPNKLASFTRAITLTAVATRVRRAPPNSEPGARDISDQLPFLEYELHKLLLAKLRMQGANALFSLQTQIAIGDRCVMAIASGTAVRLFALPPPSPPRIKTSEKDKDALEIQRALWDAFISNKAVNRFETRQSPSPIPVPAPIEPNTVAVVPEAEGDDTPALDLFIDKDACVLELDEAEDIETARALATRRVNMQVYTSSLKPTPGATPHAFAQVLRARLALSGQGHVASTAAERHVARALEGVIYKLRRLQPCALVATSFQLELPEDEIQLVLCGAAIPIQDPNKSESVSEECSSTPTNGTLSRQSQHSQNSRNNSYSNNSEIDPADDDIFALDEEQMVKPTTHEQAEDKYLIVNGRVPTTVSMTALSFMSGARISRRICALRLLFVRETTAVREQGGLSGFLHTFTCEVMAIARAYTTALGGNALTSFYLTQLMLQDNAHKNQGQCLLSIGGDIVHITY